MHRSTHISKFVTVNDPAAGPVRLNYLDWGGSGPALVFLAGRGCNSYIFDDFAPRFTSRFHVLSLTRRGHGDSDYPASGYNVDTWVEDIRQFLDELHIERAILVGHSMAGMELTRFAAQYPERVLKLIYLDAAYDYSSPEYRRVVTENPGSKIPIPGADQEFTSLQEYADFLKMAYAPLGAIWSELLDEHLAHEIRITPDGKVEDKMSEVIDRAIGEAVFAYRPEWDQIRAPTLAIHAIKDRSYPTNPGYMTPEQQAEVMAFFDAVTQPWYLHSIDKFRHDAPHAQIVEIPAGHHYCFIPQADLVFAAMMAFLQE